MVPRLLSIVMERMLLCTGNPGKVAELRALLPQGIELISLTGAGLPLDLPETGSTLEANALQKARFAFERTGLPCIAGAGPAGQGRVRPSAGV